MLVLNPATLGPAPVPCPLAPWQAAQFVAYIVAPLGTGVGLGVGVGVGVGVGAGVGAGVGVGVVPRLRTYVAKLVSPVLVICVVVKAGISLGPFLTAELTVLVLSPATLPPDPPRP